MSLNGITGASAVCCNYSPGSGMNTDLPDTGGSGGAVVNSGGNVSNRSAGGLLQRIGEALDQAIHGGDIASAQRLIDGAARTYSGGANVIPFPMVNPFKPVLQARIPVSGLNRFPNRFTYKAQDSGSTEPDDEQSNFSGLGDRGYSWGDFGTSLRTPLEYASSGPSKLETILGTIQTTLPATIQAIRANPSNIYPGNPYQIAGADRTEQTVQRVAPEGYYYDERGTLRKIGSSVGGALGDIGQSLADFVKSNPLLVLGGGAALVLLMMKPPGRRR